MTPRKMVIAALPLLSASVTASAGNLCEVTRCYDGDTCTLQCQDERVKVRLHCIDAPEMKQAPWGKMSRDYLRQRATPGATVDLVRMGQNDKYGRAVGVLLLDGVNLNLNQVHAGQAAVYPKYCTDPVFYQAQEDAKAYRRGIWQEDGEQQAPWDWRKKAKNKPSF